MRIIFNTLGKVIFSLFSLAILTLYLKAEDKDTLSYEISEVKVSAYRILSNSAMKYYAHNVISEEELRKSKAWQLSEIINTVPGIFINDYGGLGGLKTVSMRGTS